MRISMLRIVNRICCSLMMIMMTIIIMIVWNSARSLATTAATAISTGVPVVVGSRVMSVVRPVVNPMMMRRFVSMASSLHADEHQVASYVLSGGNKSVDNAFQTDSTQLIIGNFCPFVSCRALLLNKVRLFSFRFIV